MSRPDPSKTVRVVTVGRSLSCDDGTTGSILDRNVRGKVSSYGKAEGRANKHVGRLVVTQGDDRFRQSKVQNLEVLADQHVSGVRVIIVDQLISAAPFDSTKT
jgi:hypothetical protein